MVKYTNNGAGRIYVSGSVNCRTGPYRPAFFTHVFDATLGEAIATGDPTATYAGSTMIYLGPMSVTLNDLRFRHAQAAVRFSTQGSTLC